MVKDIIFFNNISLYQQCELEARKNGLKKADDFIVQTLEKYFVTKNGEKKEFKKPMDLWIALSDVAKTESVKVAELIERICNDELNPKPIIVAQEPKKEGVLHKISESLSLPRA